ncbi:hypothetical protein [Streptomyces aidingensis]|uniref:Uncharacterized protein n=1 Tax=Streptomyces aidingensis TaxID=910347 RepID=A0A1I1S4Y8_9ACTN|nr:hypothetical protein [Streptomyces aidingensis]SFD38030.1 hypothetical protein SAMN05421773_11428 [Streptomyces aidingensis]
MPYTTRETASSATRCSSGAPAAPAGEPGSLIRPGAEGGAAAARRPVTRPLPRPRPPAEDAAGPPAAVRAAAGPDGGRPEPRGCLYAISQPPLMFFLGLIGSLLLFSAAYDLLLL